MFGSRFLDLTPLQAQETALIEEVQMLADAVEKCIYENAHVALDQTEYQKRYDGLVHRYDEAKAKVGYHHRTDRR